MVTFSILCFFILFHAVNLTQPNFLIMMADDLGYGDIGCYGNLTIKTPNIDSICINGIRLSHHLAASSVCTPSRAAFLTGRYPIRSGMAETGKLRVLPFVASSGGLPLNETTFAKVLKSFGYSTALFGKWHLGVNCQNYNDNCHHPSSHGFDYFYGLPLTNLKDFGNDGAGVFMSNNPRIKTGLKSGIIAITLGAIFMARHYSHKRPCCTFFTSVALTALPLSLFYLFITNIKILNSVLMLNLTVVEQPIDFDNDLSRRLLDKGIEFIKNHATVPATELSNSQVNRQQPFLLFFSFLQVHTAFHTAPRFSGSSRHGRFGDDVHEMDWMVGRLLATLDEFGLRNDTFIYFTSDQGGHIEEKGLDGAREGGYNAAFKGGKGQGGMEGGIRVPGIISYPPLTGQLNSLDPDYRKRCNADTTTGCPSLDIPTSLMDLWPTIVNLANPDGASPLNWKSYLNSNQNFFDPSFETAFVSEEDEDYLKYKEALHHPTFPPDLIIDGLDLMPLLKNYTDFMVRSAVNKTNHSLLGYGILDKLKHTFQTTSHDEDVQNDSIQTPFYRYAHHHEFLFHYCGTDIHAIRYMPKYENQVWKAYFVTPKWIQGTQECYYVCFCYGKRNIIRHDPPILYELVEDPFEEKCILPKDYYLRRQLNAINSSTKNLTKAAPIYSHCYPERLALYRKTLRYLESNSSEKFQISSSDANYPSNQKYYEIINIIQEAVKNHVTTLRYVPNQFSAQNTIWKPWLQPCCNPPRCHCKE